MCPYMNENNLENRAQNMTHINILHLWIFIFTCLSFSLSLFFSLSSLFLSAISVKAKRYQLFQAFKEEVVRRSLFFYFVFFSFTWFPLKSQHKLTQYTIYKNNIFLSFLFSTQFCQYILFITPFLPHF